MFGKLKWRDLFEDAIKLCEDGFKIPNPLASQIKNRERQIRADPKGLGSIFIDKDSNKTYKENDTVRMPNLAKTLRLIAESGSDKEFYNGSLTKLIVNEINSKGKNEPLISFEGNIHLNLNSGGNMTESDLNNYNVTMACTNYNESCFVLKLDENYRIHLMPPPSSGILLLYAMKLMRGSIFFLSILDFI